MDLDSVKERFSKMNIVTALSMIGLDVQMSNINNDHLF
jgi:hypothetical protein